MHTQIAEIKILRYGKVYYCLTKTLAIARLIKKEAQSWIDFEVEILIFE